MISKTIVEEKGKITLTPDGGLGNRMWAISAGIKLANDIGSLLTIRWFKDKGLNCGFLDLFKPIECKNVQLKECNFIDTILYGNPRKKNLYLPRIFQMILFEKTLYDAEIVRRNHLPHDYASWATGCKVFINTCSPFYGTIHDGDFDIFKPNALIQSEIDKTFEKLSGGGQCNWCSYSSH